MGRAWFTDHRHISKDFEDPIIVRPKFLRGWWSYDVHGKEEYVWKDKDKKISVELGTKVYFHIEVEGITKDQEIEMQLYDYDYFWWFEEIDEYNMDTSEFPNDPVTKKAKVKKTGDKYIASVGVELRETWEPVVKDDHDDKFSFDRDIELYWKVSYTNKNGYKTKTTLPKKKDDYLRVGHSTRTLYIKTPVAGHNLPEFIAYDGSPMLLMEMAMVPTGQVKNMIKDKVFDALDNKIDKTISNIAFVKLEKGNLVTNKGNVKLNETAKIYTKDVYTNDGNLLKEVKQRKAIGLKHGGKTLETTKGISQYDYFSKTGRRGKVLGMVKYATGETTEMKALGVKASKNMSSFLDVFDLMKFTMDDLDTSKPLPIPLGPLTPLSNLAGLLVQEQKAEMDMWLQEVMQHEINAAKLQGLKAVKKVIQTYHDKNFTWELMSVSSETANKLLQGGFKTFDELEDFNFNSISSKNIQVLYRKITNPNTESFNYIIETFFIDE